MIEKLVFNQVVIYHDETKNVVGRNFKGHILYFVPLRLISMTSMPLLGDEIVEYFPQKELFQKIEEIRRDFDCHGKLHFTEISGKRWTKYDLAYRGVVEVSVDSLRHKGQLFFPHPLNCKIAVMFYPKLSDWSIYGGETRKEQRLRHDETILRILLKGAAHYLYDENNTIQVVKIISDGEPQHRPFDEERIIWRLIYDESYGRTPLRDYVSLAPNASIEHLPSDHKKYRPGSEEYMHASLLQVADLLLGSVIRACYVGVTECSNEPRMGEECIKKDVIAQPVKKMLEKKVKRGAGFKYSGHYRSFTINQVEFSEKEIHFRKVQPVIEDPEALQARFLFS